MQRNQVVRWKGIRLHSESAFSMRLGRSSLLHNTKSCEPAAVVHEVPLPMVDIEREEKLSFCLRLLKEILWLIAHCVECL